ncbi:MAG: hypothetical protein AB8G23_02515 [Myxococcota bacterium]
MLTFSSLHTISTHRSASPTRILAVLTLVLIAGFTTACPSGGGGGNGPSIVCDPGEQADGDTCIPCECGSYCPDGITPIECAPGRFNAGTGSIDSADCMPCAEGTAAAVSGSCVCTDCDPGQFEANMGSSSCTDCPEGTFSDMPASAECTDCSAGRFQSTTGNSACIDCNPGSFSALDGSSACTDCPSGQFQPSLGSTACQGCAPLEFQANTGSTSCESCMCDDLDPGTTDSCDAMNGTCMNVAIPLMSLDPSAYPDLPQVSSRRPPVPSMSPVGLGLFIVGLASSALFTLRDPED